MTQLMTGRQQRYMTDYFNGIFNSGNTANGVCYSVYCSEQIAYARQSVIGGQNQVFPYLAGLRFNSVNHPVCNCWNVKPVGPLAKTPVFSNIPALLGCGDTDPWVRPVYIDLIHHYLPNSQRALFVDKTHGPILSTRDGDELIESFLDKPFQK
jgi:hypothetical protein